MTTKTGLITVYARREPTTDSATADMLKVHPGLKNTRTQKDVQIYHDKKAKRPFARFPWHYSNKPTRRNKYVTLNCHRWQLVWLPDLNK